MKLQDRLPDSITVKGKRIPLDLDFRNVLRMMETLDDKTLMPDAREYLALKCLTKHPPRDTAAAMLAVKLLLFAPSKKGEEQQQRNKITDFVQDAGMIRTAFRQVYGIDLFRDKLHWLEFTELLHNLPEGNRYTETIGIRARPIPTPTKYNQKEREWLIEAKAAVALELSEEEQKNQYEASVGRLFVGLMGMIKDGEDNAKRSG